MNALRTLTLDPATIFRRRTSMKLREIPIEGSSGRKTASQKNIGDVHFGMRAHHHGGMIYALFIDIGIEVLAYPKGKYL